MGEPGERPALAYDHSIGVRSARRPARSRLEWGLVMSGPNLRAELAREAIHEAALLAVRVLGGEGAVERLVADREGDRLLARG